MRPHPISIPAMPTVPPIGSTQSVIAPTAS